MATQQALLHRTLLILGSLLKESNGSTFMSKKILELGNRVKQGDLDLYRMIQNNKYLPEALEKLEKGYNEFSIEKFWEEK